LAAAVTKYPALGQKSSHMQTVPLYSSAGSETEKIDVRLSYGIVRLFSEGLYASPNKAVEELVANSFDAGARHVSVLLPDVNEQGATIAVIDDGEGMDSAGLKTHWLIGKSLKRALAQRPLGRQQIGRFGIGKLATYVLANRLTHITKKNGKYYSTSMNFRDVDSRGDEEIEPKSPIRIGLRQLTEEQAKEALKPWTDSKAFKSSGAKLFGGKASAAWTFAILSDLKPKVLQIERGKLIWVLRTALPIRDDFAIFLDGTKLEPSKAAKGKLKRWVLGKDITELPEPAGDDVEAAEDENEGEDSVKRFSLTHGVLGRITGYAEAYKDLLTGGKSEQIGRSYGFFVYVRDRLINVEDSHFGIPADQLRHGTFGRMRVVVYMDGLDDFLQSDRERIREGPARVAAQNILRAIFNFVRQYLNKYDLGQDPGTRLSSTLAATPGSMSRRPIIELVRASLAGSASSRYIQLPVELDEGASQELLSTLEGRAETPELFVTGSDVVFDVPPDRGIAMYDAVTGVMRINGFHPFVAAFYDDFSNTTSGLALELFAMAEVLLESQLFQAGHSQKDIDATMLARDQYLRDVATRSGPRTALAVANALRDARNDQYRLEVELVAAFDKLGFKASQPGRKSAKDPGKDKPDGIAVAVLGGDASGRTLRYSVTLEAKSTQKDGKRVPAGDVGVSVIAQHRDSFKAEHAVVVAASFATTRGDEASVAQQIARDRQQSKAAGEPKTITLITIDDLARLVRIAPTKQLGLPRLRELFETCSLPEQSRAWVDKLEASQPKRLEYREVIDTIYQLQEKHNGNAVEYYGLMVALGMRHPPVKIDLDRLTDLCRGMSNMAPGYMTAGERSVGIEQSPANVLAAVISANKAHLADEP
jgi:hypothetical protein